MRYTLSHRRISAYLLLDELGISLCPLHCTRVVQLLSLRQSTLDLVVLASLGAGMSLTYDIVPKLVHSHYSVGDSMYWDIRMCSYG